MTRADWLTLAVLALFIDGAVVSAAEELREAARLMRERAEDATPGPWRKRRGMGGERVESVPDDVFVAEAYSRVDMRHIASWHPAVALAVAVWLDACADFEGVLNRGNYETPDSARWKPHQFPQALAVARAYLGTT